MKKTKNKIRSIVIDLGSDPEDTDVSFALEGSPGELWSVEEFKGRTQEELSMIQESLKSVIKKYKVLKVMWGAI